MSTDGAPAFVITVSGSDASGAAGMQADNRAILSMGVFPLNVVSALTLQTERGVESIEITAPELVRLHLLGLLKAYPVAVIKAGMLGNVALVQVLVEILSWHPRVKLVLDPVIRASSGRPLLDGEGLGAMREDLLPKTYLLTPNLPELCLLSGVKDVEAPEYEKLGAVRLLDRGCHSILVKGGHRREDQSVDRLYKVDNVREFGLPRVKSTNTRGTGCVLSSLVAAGLAKGLALEDAVSEAKQRLYSALLANRESRWPGPGPSFI